MTQTTEVVPQIEEKVPGLRAFRGSAEVENFYRFVHENSLRKETHLLLSTIVSAIKQKNKRRKSSKLQ